MTGNDALSLLRTILGYIGLVLIVVALAKFCGIVIPQVRGEWWQMAILGLALK